MTDTSKSIQKEQDHIVTTVDTETLQRVLKIQPVVYTPTEIERDAKRCEPKTFTLLK